MKYIKKNILILIIWLFFMIFATILFILTNNIFYLLNFLYIAFSVCIGIYLMAYKKTYGRKFTQFSIFIYMFVYLGIICRENMSLEGFWYYLFLGVFENAVIHYFVAKIFGPIIFGRGWCGYACWTGAVFDLLPYKIPKTNLKNMGFIKYIVFLLSFIYVLLLFVLNIDNKENIMFLSFIIVNIIYYVSGILLAISFSDNRAFCKYICPITVFLKPTSYFSFLKVKCNHDKCIKCKKCLNVCLMNVDILDDNRKRKNGTECILCLNCINVCKKNALQVVCGF